MGKRLFATAVAVLFFSSTACNCGEDVTDQSNAGELDAGADALDDGGARRTTAVKTERPAMPVTVGIRADRRMPTPAAPGATKSLRCTRSSATANAFWRA